MRYNRHGRLLFVAALSALFTACGSHANTSNVPPLSTQNSSSAASAFAASVAGSDVQLTTTSRTIERSCPTISRGDVVRCFALLRTDVDAGTATVQGFGPAEIAEAYALPTGQGSGQTVGIVDAYNDPNAEADLAVYRTHYNLPPCTSANGCFKQVGQSGGAVPADDAGWSAEISLDLDMVSATCPNCRIVLVEANSPTFQNLGKAENEAVALGATVVSNSYGGGESTMYDAHFDHPGVIITASAGDNGSAAQQPCSLGTVVCVGGTHLVRSTTARGWSETVWSGTGSGCSAMVPKPDWQTDRLCPKRSETDVSAVADPATGVAVYDSIVYQAHAGWEEFGGTSVSSPIVASIYALAGNSAGLHGASRLWKALGSTEVNDVIEGNNGVCSVAYRYICNARVGYDGPSGVGTPNGVGAF